MEKKRYLLHVYESLDIEYDRIDMMIKELRSEGKASAADNLEEAKRDLMKVIFGVKKSWKFLEDKPTAEQIKMDI